MQYHKNEKNEIVCIQKLESITNKSVTLLTYCVKLCKPANKLFSENVFQHRKKSHKLRTTISQDDWTIVYLLIHYLIKKLQAFPYKINLRCVYTNEILMKFKLSETEMCTFCFETKETMTHLLYYCTHVRLLWFQFAQCFKTKCGITIDVTPETCILGMLSGDHFNIINTCIIIIKHFTFTCKL